MQHSLIDSNYSSSFHILQVANSNNPDCALFAHSVLQCFKKADLGHPAQSCMLLRLVLLVNAQTDPSQLGIYIAD